MSKTNVFFLLPSILQCCILSYNLFRFRFILPFLGAFHDHIKGSLPGKPEQNPKETMKAITLRSGKEFPPRVLTKDGEKQGG